MSLLLLTASAISLASTLLLILSPLPIGLWILLLSLIFSLSISISTSSWFGLIFFLIYVGGLLVIFAYFVALSPNQQLAISSPIIFFFFTCLITFSILYHNYLISSPLITSPIFPPHLIFYSLNNAPILIAIALLLFLTLVAVVKIARRVEGPLRPFNYV